MTEAAAKYKTAQLRATYNKHEDRFMRDILALRLPEPRREYRFAADVVGLEGPGIRERLKSAGLKDWRFDFAWTRWKLAFEIEGAPGHGRHTTAKGFTGDCEKYAEATLLGWTVYRVPGDWVQAGDMKAINLLVRALKVHAGWTP